MMDNERLLFAGALLVDIGAFCSITMLVVWELAPLYIQDSISGVVSVGIGLSMINGLFGILFMVLGSVFCIGNYILSKAGAP